MATILPSSWNLPLTTRMSTTPRWGSTRPAARASVSWAPWSGSRRAAKLSSMSRSSPTTARISTKKPSLATMSLSGCSTIRAKRSTSSLRRSPSSPSRPASFWRTAASWTRNPWMSIWPPAASRPWRRPCSRWTGTRSLKRSTSQAFVAVAAAASPPVRSGSR